MKRILLCSSICLCLMAMIACHDESALTPTEQPEMGYVLPQGNHDFDKRIVAWQEKANFFILYKFADKDIRWQYNTWLDEEEITYTFADTNYINKQLDLIESKFLNFYSLDILREGMPLKLMLLGQLDDYSSYVHKHNIYVNFDGFAMAWGDNSIDNMTAAQRNAFKTDVNQAFVKRLMDNGLLQVPEAFSKVSVYNSVSYSRDKMYGLGFLALNQSRDAIRDFNKYVEVILSNPKSFLESPSTNTFTHEGILTDAKDVNGLIRLKYEAVVEYFNSLGIDIQGIGDAVEK
ncbi:MULTISPECIES: hypothetical protein [Butyricimonas]|uniref:hypothetical protein n=1 Tax=Butyricimonas TaxID=574697 RepID=UPI0011DD36D7|nr:MULTISPECIES: hypothetical protein [Butyricimonas]